MYDRVIPCEIYESDEFIGLPSNTARVVYLALYNEADDFGNIQTTPRYPSRWFATIFQIKTDAAMCKVMQDLCNSGLIRTYDSDGVKCLHLPLFRNHRTYTRRVAPPSPWCDPNAATGPFKAGTRRENRTIRANSRFEKNRKEINAADEPSESEMTVQVGVQNDCERLPLALPGTTRLAMDWTLPEDWKVWAMQYAASQNMPMSAGQIERFGAKFHEHWHRRAGAKGARSDWFETFRNWFRCSGLAPAESRNRDADGLGSIGRPL
jgi:hypothetical protein